MNDMAELYKALISFQSEIKAVKKGKDGYGYKYADLPSTWDYIRPILAKHGLGVMQFPVNSEGGRHGVRTILVHHSGASIEDTCYSIDTEIKGGMTGIQKQGCDITYLRRYALGAVLGLTTEEDTDGK